ncbi:Lrp/AsnC family transcriptional regulator [Leifsonia shinshuensis]|uniref:DNA-binding Lrp family transcriptional regulator n=1 Tax=Leifsonia shinshuensis TaxID=150026 RepID=A0A853CSC1_9MICO|nr:Lrp/AsnC family transcriptional regulator [Leifsonia shinshuensis]NYJ22803.1 DNA-binding Lrp family transcriptional regulator [Leifsonia shinshuensis]
MDSITEEALALLRTDGRLSFAELARELGVPRPAIAARISPLLESGELRIVAAVHPRFFGLNVMAHIAMRISGDVDRVVEEITASVATVFISETVGPEQLVVEVHVRTLGELQAILKTIRGLPGVLDARHLIYDHVLNSFFLGAEPEGPGIELDDADGAIIQILQHDGRAPYRELARHAGLSITAVRSRLHHLVDSGIMRIGALGQRTDSIGGLVFGVGVNLDGADDELIELISRRRGLEFMARTVGRFDLVATIAFSSLQDFNAFLDQVRRSPGTRAVTSWLHARIRLERYQFMQRDEDAREDMVG